MAGRKRAPGAQVALLRGINVGGRNKLAMRDLVRLFEGAGAEDVRTHIQSGNVVFRATTNLATRIPTLVGTAIAADAGLTVPVVTRSARQLRAIVAAHPFARRGIDPKLLHVAFLAGKPAANRVKTLDPDRSPPDRFAVKGSEVYLHCPNGMARTKLNNAYLDARLGLVSTIRNWNTVLKLLEMCDS